MNELIIPTIIIIAVFCLAIYVRRKGSESNVHVDSALEEMPSQEMKTISNLTDENISSSLREMSEDQNIVCFNISETEWISVSLLSQEDLSFAVCYGRDSQSDDYRFSNSPKTISEIEALVKDSLKGDWSWVDRYTDWEDG